MSLAETDTTHYNIFTLPGISDFYQHPMGLVVVADSEEICDQALKLIKIEWEERPFVLDFEEALKPDAPKIWSEVERLRRRPKLPTHNDQNFGNRGCPEGLCQGGKISNTS